jgi:hypothetical protein
LHRQKAEAHRQDGLCHDTENHRAGESNSNCFTNSVSIFMIFFRSQLRHLEDNFAEQVAVFHAFVGFAAFFQRQYYVDYRFQEAATQQFQRGK